MEFKEKQRFTQWWLWLILIIMSLIPLYPLLEWLFFGRKPEDSILSLVIPFVFFLGITILLASMRLVTEINAQGIRMHFSPFVSKNIAWDDIRSIQVINYGFIGGWGIRLWTDYGTVYNTRGNKGMAIVLKDGKKFLIGTQKEEALRAVVEAYAPSGSGALNPE